MKTQLIVRALGVSLLVSLGSGAIGAQTAQLLGDHALKLDEAVAVSLANSADLRKASAQLFRAQAGIAEISSSLKPQVGVNLSASYSDRANVIDLGRIMGGPSLPLTIAEQWNPMVAVGLTWHIDLFGAVKSAKSQAEYSALAQMIDLDRLRNEISWRTRTSFYGVARAYGQLDVARRYLQTVQLRLQMSRINESAGNVAKFDVISAERDVAAAELAVSEAGFNRSQALAELKRQMGLDQTEKLELDFALSPPPDTGEMQLDALLKEAGESRPELMEAIALVEARKRGHRYAKRSMLPMLSAGINAVSMPNHGAFSLSQSTTASLNLTIPIFDGGIARARMQAASSELTAAEEELNSARKSVQLQVQSSLLHLQLAQASLKSAAIQVGKAKEAQRLAETRYRVGVSQSSVVSPQLELSSAQTALVDAETQLINAGIDVMIAQSGLDFAVGRYAKPLAPSEKKNGTETSKKH